MFLKNDFKNMDVAILKKLCKNENVKNCSKLKKGELFETFNSILAVRIIQRCYRRHFYKNATDHITLESVSYPCFIYRTKSKKLYFYEYESIIKYIMKTGDCRDPMTRENYSDDDLKRLDSEAKKFNLKYRSCYKIKKNLSYARRIRNRENEILSFQMRLDELKEMVYYIIQSEMYLWNLGTEPILIENVEYRTLDSFINSVIHELKMVLINLSAYDQHSAESFKSTFLSTVRELIQNVSQTNNLLNLINLN
jgi:hypothetical protein